jgi:carbon monoxide dehydrogenase subunit G
MASIRQEIHVKASPAQAWDAMRDVGALHVRLVPGFVTDVRLEPGARIVTFGNGVVAREAIVDLDDNARRIAWSASGGRLSHHNASAEVFADVGGGSRIVWTCDLLPDEMRDAIDGMISQGMAAMKRTLDALGEEAAA